MNEDKFNKLCVGLVDLMIAINKFDGLVAATTNEVDHPAIENIKAQIVKMREANTEIARVTNDQAFANMLRELQA